MSTWKLVRLNFGRSPVHFGETGIGIEEATERVRSDTLFSAWMSAYARIFGAEGVEQLLAQFTANPNVPPFRLSSTFVYRCPKDSKAVIYYLPKLLGQPPGYPSSDDFSFAKAYKKIHYLPLAVWQRWYQGSGFSGQDAADLEVHAGTPENTSTKLAKAGCFAYSEAFKKYTLPKVAVDRTHHATNFFHTGLVQFAWEAGSSTEQDAWENAGVQNLAGLYFLIEFPANDPALEADLQQALAVLGEEGLGGERSSGAGRFTMQAWDSLPAEWQAVVNFEQGNYHSLVSLLWQPNPDVLLDPDTRYAIQERGGWIASPSSGRQLRRKKVQMFAEGSIFTHKPTGQLADVTPGGFNRHAVYRSGLAVSLPVKLEAS